MKNKVRTIKNDGKKYSWVKYIHNRIQKNKNFLGFISGQTGSGKSWASLAMAELIDPKFDITRVVFRADQLMELINSDKLKPGSVIVFEEAGIEMDSANWQSIINKAMKYLFETFRHRRFILIMNAPLMHFMAKGQRSLMHAVFQTQRIDMEKETTVLKPMLLQYNERYDKTYWKFLRVRNPGGSTAPIKKWAVPKASEKLLADYELKKREFTDKLNKEIMEDIKKAAEKKNPKKYTVQCKSCSYSWQSKKEIPTRCPSCGKYANKEPKKEKNDKTVDKEVLNRPKSYRETPKGNEKHLEKIKDSLSI